MESAIKAEETQKYYGEEFDVDFKVTNDWSSAFNGEISIKNNTEKDIEDWILEFDYDREINTFWTASIEEHQEKTLYSKRYRV